MCNSMSLNTTPKEVFLVANAVQKHEHNIYIDKLASPPMEET